MCPWVGYGSSLILNFPICEMERIGAFKVNLAMIQNLGERRLISKTTWGSKEYLMGETLVLHLSYPPGEVGLFNSEMSKLFELSPNEYIHIHACIYIVINIYTCL